MPSGRSVAAATVVILLLLTTSLIVRHREQGSGSYFTPIHIDICGNGVCEPNGGETCAVCPEDCGCSNGQICNEWGVCVEPEEDENIEIDPHDAQILMEYAESLAKSLDSNVVVFGPFLKRGPSGTYLVAHVARYLGDTRGITNIIYYVVMDPGGMVKTYVPT